MTQGVTRRRTTWGYAGLLAAGCTLALSPVFAGPAVKELDPVLMVTIPAGPFLMGTQSPKGRADEWPQRTVQVDAFAIDEVEVTNERYMTFVTTTGHRSPPNPYGTGVLVSAKGIEQLPVVQVTWYDAKAFCAWAKKRLPTEAEWEKAARGTDGRTFPWGEDAPTAKRANYDREWADDRTLHAVGSLPGGDSPYGIKDMSGNAREWVQDWYDGLLRQRSDQESSGTRQGHCPRDSRRVVAQPSLRHHSHGSRTRRIRASNTRDGFSMREERGRSRSSGCAWC